jgi:hypothetical protein
MRPRLAAVTLDPQAASGELSITTRRSVLLHARSRLSVDQCPIQELLLRAAVRRNCLSRIVQIFLASERRILSHRCENASGRLSRK